MPGWHTSSTWIKVALVCMAVGTAVYVVGFATPSWVTNYNLESYGLWTYTYGWRTSRPLYIRRVSWFQATQALECIGLIGLGLALILLVFYMCVLSCKRRNTLIATIIITFGAVFFIVVGVAVFVTNFNRRGYDIDWSCGLAIAGAILAFISGVMQALELCGK